MNCILEFNLRSKEAELVISEYLRQYSETIATWLNVTLFDLQSITIQRSAAQESYSHSS